MNYSTDMQYTTLGRTNLRVSVMAMGSGGNSRLGLNTGKSKADAIALVRRAIERGINIFDTADAYKTQPILAAAMQPFPRDEIVLSTKKTIVQTPRLLKRLRKKRRLRPEELKRSIERSLKQLRTDYIDIYHLHGVRVEDYDYAVQELLPVLVSARDSGKIRFVGITEAFSKDTTHQMLSQAVTDPYWDVMMVGFNLLNFSARERVLAPAIAQNIGIMAMFAVRRALTSPTALRPLMEELLATAHISPVDLKLDDPLGFLIHEAGATSLTDAAYRFCRHEAGIHTVLFGTGNTQHLDDNVISLLRPPLPAADIARIQALFGGIDHISGQ